MYPKDILMRQQQIIELRLRYRTEFRQIMDEPRASRVYKIEDEFRQRARDILMENKQHDRPFRRNRSMIEIQ
jgi:hypothetical protein